MMTSLRRSLRKSALVNGLSDAAAMFYLRSIGKRPDDVYLCSFAKSGRTWLRFMLGYYQIHFFKIPMELRMNNFTTLSPNVIFTSNMGLWRASRPPDQIHRILGSHSEYPLLFKGCKIIFLTRDIKDTLVSYYHHLTANGDFSGTFEEFTSSSFGMKKIIRYYKRWERAINHFKRERLLHMSYADLKENTADCLRQCLNFMGIPIDEEFLAASLQYGSRENIRALELKYGTYDPGWGAAYEKRLGGKRF